MGSKLHAPRTGPGYSTGQKAPRVSTESGPRVGNSAGLKSGADRSGDPKSSHGGSRKAGNMAAMRKPYK